MDIALSKGLAILEYLARKGGPGRLSVIAEELALPKSGVHRILRSLCALGYVAHDQDTRQYRATLKTWELGAVILSSHPARQAAAPYMQELHRSTQETVNLLVLDGDDILFLEKLLSPRPLRFTTQPGTRVPAPLTASGLAMLAFEPDARMLVERVISTQPRARDLDVEQIMNEISEARVRGYAISYSRATPGVMGVSAPIMGANNRAVAAIAVSGPVDRIGGVRQQEIVEAVLIASARIAESVGRW